MEYHMDGVGVVIVIKISSNAVGGGFDP